MTVNVASALAVLPAPLPTTTLYSAPLSGIPVAVVL